VRNHSEAFIEIDTSKLRNAIAIAEGGRGGEVRYLGKIDSADTATRKLAKLAVKYRSLRFCYEAGPTAYGLYRLIRSLGHDCMVAAPSLIESRRSNETNQRYAVELAKLSRAGELTAVWVRTLGAARVMGEPVPGTGRVRAISRDSDDRLYACQSAPLRDARRAHTGPAVQSASNRRCACSGCQSRHRKLAPSLRYAALW
jgi:hypothetical protein